jgi:hypothetical protein
VVGRYTLTDEHSDSTTREGFIGANKMFSGRIYRLAISVATWSKEWICGCSPAGFAGSNPAGALNFASI